MIAEVLEDWIAQTRKFEIVDAIPVSVCVEDLLPHRDDMLLLDGVCHIAASKDAVRARMEIRADDPVLRGHFPGDPVYPGVLLVEAISQAAVCLIKLSTQKEQVAGRNEKVRAIKLLYAEFSKEVRPGDRLHIEARAFEITPFLSILGGRVVRNGVVCAIAIVEIYVGE